MRGHASWKTSIIAAFIAHVRPSQERVPLMLSSDGGPLPATEAAYMDQSMRRAWASAAFQKVQQPSCLLELSPVPLRTASRTCPLSLGFVIRKGHELAFRTTYEGFVVKSSPACFAVPGLDARAKKRKSGFDLCFSFRNVPAKIVGAGRAEVLENLFLIHKPSKSSHLIYVRKSICFGSKFHK